jgi:DNA-binding IclR family transcriptional regulator
VDQVEDRNRGASPSTAVGVLDRAVAVLDAVEDGARSVTVIRAATGLTRSTTHRLVRSLEDHGFLSFVAARGYSLGPRLLGLASTAWRELPLRELAHPTVERLARSTGESAQLYVRDGDRRLCVDAVESDQELRAIVDVGASLPLTKGSAGKVFLAWAPADDRDRVAGETDDPDRLLGQVATTRRRGWAESRGERATGVASVSAPVVDPAGTLAAVVSVSGPERRLGGVRARRYAPAVTAAAREIERALGVR